MKSFVAILLITCHFLSTTELYQLLKVPVLISHFMEHKENDNMSFKEYITHHYGGHEIDDDWEVDNKLPFMQHSDLLQVMVVSPKNILFTQLKNTSPFFNNTFSFYKNPFIPFGILFSIWQPPKFNA